ncbi:hypothetical protein SEVIR_2G082900v4 [Setaria viridis]|uniref:Shugoshin C-terminal domain-containing protein n=1 Tax=Setaria viridis TaxID=4556 RepID=A0A4U6VT97_SETVI|nr:shugoshin-1-like isoform X1 [Setaria viridis]TKW31099.1 hypothetical protein SEVIR_2G082900v2 [Setaria viridis]
MAAAAAPGGPAVGGSNPSGDGGPRLRSPPGKGIKPVALADITNVGRPNTSRSVSIGDVVKENAKLIHLLTEKTKVIELSRVEMHKLRIALQVSRQQNMQLAQTNSQMLAELNMGKDRIKTLQHELSCTTALLKVKDSELERKNKTANQRRKEVNSQEVLKAISSKGAAVEAHQIHGSITSGVEHQLLKSQSAVPSRTDCQKPPQDATIKRGKNKRKSGSNECIKDTNIMQEHYEPHLQPILSLDHEDRRKTQRRRSSRLNQVPCEIAEVSHKTLHEDIIVPSPSSTLSVQKHHGPTAGKDTGKSLQNECSAVVHEELMSSVVEEIEINEQPQKGVNLKVQEACSSVTRVEAHQIDVKACDTKHSHLASQSSVPFNITEPPKPPEDTCIKRSSNKQKLALCETGEAVEDVNSKCGVTISEQLRQEKKRKSQRRGTARLNSVSAENTDSAFETLQEDVIAPLASSSSIASMEQKTTQKQNDACSSMKSTEGQVVAGRRSLRRAAEKVVSYKEIPLNVKMRRP